MFDSLEQFVICQRVDRTVDVNPVFVRRGFYDLEYPSQELAQPAKEDLPVEYTEMMSVLRHIPWNQQI